jgi:hypothetical protein
MDSKKEFERAKTLPAKIGALRELLSVPHLGRFYIRFAGRMIAALRHEAAGSEELLRRLDLCDETLAFRKDQEKCRLMNRLKKAPKTPEPQSASAAPAPTDIWDM